MKKFPFLALLLSCIFYLPLSISTLAQDEPAPADKPLTIEPAILTIIDQADIPAQEAGALVKLNFTEGMQIRQGDLLAELDYREQEMLRGKARYEVEFAAAKAASNVQLDFAKVSHEIAKADEARALESEKKFAKSVSKTELDQLRLAVEKTRFEITHAEEEQALAKISLLLKKQELDLASYKLELRRIIAPFDGTVAQRYRRVGEWVQPGDKVLRLIRTDRLRIEAFVALKSLPPQPTGGEARWVVTLPDMKEQSYPAKLTFVSPEANPVNGQVRVWAEIDNTGGALRAGQVGRLEIVTGRLVGAVEKPVEKPAATTVAEKLKKVTSLSFERDSLEQALVMLSKDIGVPIEIIGGDLQLEGITKNQSFRLDEQNKAAGEILQVILNRVNRGDKLVYMIKPKLAGGEDILFITTRAAVAKRGDKLPPELLLNNEAAPNKE